MLHSQALQLRSSKIVNSMTGIESGKYFRNSPSFQPIETELHEWLLWNKTFLIRKVYLFHCIIFFSNCCVIESKQVLILILNNWPALKVTFYLQRCTINHKQLLLFYWKPFFGLFFFHCCFFIKIQPYKNRGKPKALIFLLLSLPTFAYAEHWCAIFLPSFATLFICALKKSHLTQTALWVLFSQCVC